MKHLTITSTIRRTGNETDSIISKATYRNARIVPFYDVPTGNLQINGEWYLIPDAELAELREALNDHFKKVMV